MTNSNDLCALARARLVAGELPVCDAERLYAGAGTLTHCAVCGAVIDPQHIEYEIAAARDATYWLHMHVPCYDAWKEASGELVERVCGEAAGVPDEAAESIRTRK